MSEFFTSDTHFGHANIIAYCGRPFVDIDHMNRDLIARWNARVGPADTVYHLGDFAMGKRESISGFRSALNGRIALVLGNHDRSMTAMLGAGFDEVHRELNMSRGIWLYLRHEPADQWIGDVHLHGHVHNRWVRMGDMINVGVDVRGFEPKRLEELL